MRVCLGVLGLEEYNGVKQRRRSYGARVRGVESFFLISVGSRGILSG